MLNMGFQTGPVHYNLYSMFFLDPNRGRTTVPYPRSTVSDKTSWLRNIIMSKIVSTEDTLHGKPRVKGTRVGAGTLYELYTLKEMSLEEIADQYPSITVEDVETAVEYMKNEKDGQASVTA